MTFWAGDKLKKPARWGFDKGLTDPKWDWFWHQGSSIVFPMWEGIGPVLSDIVQGAVTSQTSTPDWQSTRIGQRRHYDSGEFDASNIVPSVIYPFTFIVYVLDPVTLTGTQANWYMALVDSGQPAHMVVLGSQGNIGWRYFVRRNGSFDANNFAVCEGGTQDANPHLLVATSRNATEHELFDNGVSIELDTNNCDTFAVNRFDFGRINDTSPTNSFNAGVVYTAFIPAALSKAEAVELAADPFGPFRMVDEIEKDVLSVVAVAADNSILPWIRRRRR